MLGFTQPILENRAVPFRILPLLIACAGVASAPVHARDAGGFPPGWIHERPVPKPPQAVSPMPTWYEVRGGTWQVPLTTLQRIAGLLKVRLAGNPDFDPPRPDQAIQFRGETVDGQRIVRLYGYCAFGHADTAYLSETFLDVRDGWRCVFDAEYDPAQQRMRSFSYYLDGGTGS
ncbi:hypothetical protein [uncultured Massilia sp.]|uniref:hypothetical protein n=1 Tax=uncultured Massilia sp. TaxID=169973 RepID=UPI0025835523|nr:hypothetical protein [uncultured Massilia sp.]